MICACCWNSLKVDAGGTLWALYRDDQPRDLVLASSRDGGEIAERPVTPADLAATIYHHMGVPLDATYTLKDAPAEPETRTGKDGLVSQVR